MFVFKLHRQVTCFALLVTMSGCADQYGSPIERGYVQMNAPTEIRYVYLLSLSTYEKNKELLGRANAEQALDLLQKHARGIPTRSQNSVGVEAGSFMMCYVCGNRAEVRPVQVHPSGNAAKPQLLQVDCP